MNQPSEQVLLGTMLQEIREKTAALIAEPAVVRRALGFGLGVGAVLVAINHGDAILAGEVDGRRWLKIGLTVLVPYCVSTASSVMAIRERGR